MEIREEKARLRRELLKKMLTLTKEELKRRSENVENLLSNLPKYKQANLIMGYFPLRGEPQLWEMFRKAEGKRFCFPVIDLKRRELYPYEIKNWEEDFVEGPFKVREPDIKKTSRVDIEEIDVVVVPGLAFDYQRNRLGRGAGYYDRFLKRIKPPTVKIGVAFQFQILKSLPVHLSFDEKVNIVVSEKEVI